MANMNPKKNPMPTQKAGERAHNFREVAEGYTEEQALDEAARCLSCKNMPCVAGCPVHIHIPAFIEKVREGDFEAMKRLLLHEGTWSRMLREGATATFEGWGKDCKWNTSLFHMTMSAAAIFLSDADLTRIFS